MVEEEVLLCSDGFHCILKWNFGKEVELRILGWALGIGVNLYGHVELCTLNDGQSFWVFFPQYRR